MVFHWSLRDSKSLQVSRTRLRILAVLSNAVVWIVSTHPPPSKSSRLFNNPLVIVPKAPITTGTIVTFIFHSFFNSLARSWYFICPLSFAIGDYTHNISVALFSGLQVSIVVIGNSLRIPNLTSNHKVDSSHSTDHAFFAFIRFLLFNRY